MTPPNIGDQAGANAAVCQYFLAGTDTGVGKTRVTVGLLAAGQAQGLKVAGMKPVASGATIHDGRLFNDDALRIANFCPQLTPYEFVNPYCLAEPVSPHIAAQKANIEINTAKIAAISRKISATVDLLLIEGTGGWYCPISADESMADVARALAAPILVVVGLKLGCLNHARLTREAIARSPCHLAGWIGSQVEAHFEAAAANLSTLERLFGMPPLAVLPHAADPAHDADWLGDAVRQLKVATKKPLPLRSRT